MSKANRYPTHSKNSQPLKTDQLPTTNKNLTSDLAPNHMLPTYNSMVLGKLQDVNPMSHSGS